VNTLSNVQDPALVERLAQHMEGRKFPGTDYNTQHKTQTVQVTCICYITLTKKSRGTECNRKCFTQWIMSLRNKLLRRYKPSRIRKDRRGRKRGGGGICIKFNFQRIINFSITLLKLKSTTLSDELKLTMFITILKHTKYNGERGKDSHCLVSYINLNFSSWSL
jgi:hypothetical protein